MSSSNIPSNILAGYNPSFFLSSGITMLYVTTNFLTKIGTATSSAISTTFSGIVNMNGGSTVTNGLTVDNLTISSTATIPNISLSDNSTKIVNSYYVNQSISGVIFSNNNIYSSYFNNNNLNIISLSGLILSNNVINNLNVNSLSGIIYKNNNIYTSNFNNNYNYLITLSSSIPCSFLDD